MSEVGKWLMVGSLTESGEKYAKYSALNKCERAAEKFGYSLDEIKQKNRKAELIDLKRCICKHLTDCGWTVTRTGEVMNMHHTSVIYHRKKFDGLFEYDNGFKQIWGKFITA